VYVIGGDYDFGYSAETIVMPRLHNALLSAFILIAAGLLLGWNSSRFLSSKPVIRAKNLDFLPAPDTARLLALGHTNTLAKLRWIDSFAYFQYQLDRKDDSVAGGGQGFQRLYETLIDLDPKFQPFYEHAALNTSGVLSQHWVALGFLLRGTQELPKSRELWRNAATTLKTFFAWDTKQPLQFDAFLADWEANEELPEAKRMVWDWKRGFGRQVFTGLEQLPYWLEQLERTQPKTPNGEFVDSVIRELLARYGAQELNALAATWRLSRGGVPQTRKELVQNLTLLDPLVRVPETEPTLVSLQQLLDPRLVRKRYPKELPPYGPLTLQADGRLTLNSDPYGLPWEIAGNTIISSGQERVLVEKRLAGLTDLLLTKAQKEGHWPATLVEVAAMGIEVPPSPTGGTIILDGRQLLVKWSVEPQAPWVLRKKK
jgi:hypothetical protein